MLLKPPHKILIDKRMVLKCVSSLSCMLTQQMQKKFIVGKLCNHFYLITRQDATYALAPLCFRNPGFIIRVLQFLQISLWI